MKLGDPTTADRDQLDCMATELANTGMFENVPALHSRWLRDTLPDEKLRLLICNLLDQFIDAH